MLERTRLNDRIHAITGTPLAKELAKYRRDLCKPAAVDKRGCGMILVDYRGRRFMEPADLVVKLHAWLDEHSVPKLTATGVIDSA